MDTGLVWVCITSFIAVFVVLVFLAVIMHFMTLVFPVKKLAAVAAGSDDAAIYAAVTSTYTRLYPGMKVTKIDEIKK